MDFLREHAPELYIKAVRVAMERDEYERALRRAKTREEVERLQHLQMANLTDRLRHLDPEEGEMLVNAIADVNREYQNSDEYKEIMRKKSK